ncbi:hypothetical protein D3C86_1926990 [compost metagenome]
MITRFARFRIGVFYVVEYLDFRTGRVGAAVFFVFNHVVDDPAVTAFGDLPFQFEFEITVFFIGNKVFPTFFSQNHGTVFYFPLWQNFVLLPAMPSVQTFSVEKGYPLSFLSFRII